MKPENVDMTFGFGGHADLGPIVSTLHLYPSIEYWGKSYYKDFSFNADVRYYFPMSGGGMSPFAGGGLCFIYGMVDIPGWGSDSDLDFGFEILGGIDFPVGFGTAFLEGKFQMQDGNVFKVSGGATFPMGG
jgi:hypothetical protein